MNVTVRNIILVALVSLPLLLHAQKNDYELIDSLLARLPAQNDDTAKVRLLNKLAIAYLYVKPTEGMKYGKLGLSLAERLNDKKGIAVAYAGIGAVNSLQGNLAEALNDLNAALKLFAEQNDKYGIGRCYYAIGVVLYLQSNHADALQHFISALQVMDETGDEEGKALCYVHMGNVHCVQVSYPEALQYYNLAVKVADTIHNKRIAVAALTGMATMYNNATQLDEAMKCILEAKKMADEIRDQYAAARCYNIIGLIYTNKKKYRESLENYLVAARILQELGADWPLSTALAGIGDTYFYRKIYGESERYYKEALSLGIKTGSTAILMRAYRDLSDLYTMTGKYKNALESYKSFENVYDSAYSLANARKIVQLQMQYDFDKKESVAEVEQMRKDAAQKLQIQRKNIFIYGALSALAALLIIGSLLFRQRKLKADHQRIELEQKQLRAQMNPHFIFNCLNSIQHFVVANDELNANKYLSGFASLMRQTLENSKADTISLRKEMAYLGNYLSLEMMRFEDEFTYEITCDDHVDTDIIELPSMIVQPFVENAIQHGLCYLTDRKGVLKISFHMDHGFLYCKIDDNGIGREQSQKLRMTSETTHESHGMNLTRQRLALISKSYGSDYKIEITDKKNAANESEGTTVTIKFPARS